MKTLKLIIGFLFLAGLTFAANAQKLSHVTIDTEIMYRRVIDSLNETNDCSVRALSVATNVKYIEAHSKLKELGRVNRTGTTVGVLARSLEGYNISLNKLDDMPVSEFVKLHADKDYKYILIYRGHVSALVYDSPKDKWIVYGNYGDTVRKLIGIIKIKI